MGSTSHVTRRVSVRATGADRQGTVRQCSSGGLLDIARAFEQGEIDIDPDDDKLAAQLGSIKWGIDSRGGSRSNRRTTCGKRGLPSPDRADAMAIAFAGKANAVPMNMESPPARALRCT